MLARVFDRRQYTAAVFNREFNFLCMCRRKGQGILILGSVGSPPKAQIPEPALLAGVWQMLVFNSNLSFLFPKGAKRCVSHVYKSCFRNHNSSEVEPNVKVCSCLDLL